jgi:hypothetical protein
MSRKLWLLILTVILIEFVRAALSSYLATTSQAAVSQELETWLGPWGSWLAPALYQLSPELSQGVGSYLHARQEWGWSALKAVAYGFPGLFIAVPVLVLGLGQIGWRAIGRQREATRAASQASSPGQDGSPGGGRPD